jgi:hypothetical protein
VPDRDAAVSHPADTAPVGLLTLYERGPNLAMRNLAQLTALVNTRLRRMQYRPALLAGTGLAHALL